MAKYDIETCRREYPKEKLTDLLSKFTYRELENKFGYSERVFSQLAKEYCIPKNHKIINKNKNQVEFNLNHVLYLYNECNYSLRRIAKLYNTTHSTVKKFLTKNNQEIRSGYSSEYYVYKEGICNRGKKPYSRYEQPDSQGYIVLSINGRLVREHRYIMEQYMGRELTSEEYVHHIDFVKTNNNIENLFLFKNEGNTIHQMYHSYIKNNEYLSPQEYVDLYEEKIIYFLSLENLRKLYIEKDYSAVQISQIFFHTYGIPISRQAIVEKLKKYQIFYERDPHINQYDTPQLNLKNSYGEK